MSVWKVPVTAHCRADDGVEHRPFTEDVHVIASSEAEAKVKAEHRMRLKVTDRYAAPWDVTAGTPLERIG